MSPLFTFYEHATPVARERNPTAQRVPIRRYADPPIRFPYTLEKAANNLRQTHPYEIAELLNSLWT
jgi:hypothetical protein